MSPVKIRAFFQGDNYWAGGVNDSPETNPNMVDVTDNYPSAF